MFENETVDVPCSKCGAKHSKKIGWLKSTNQFTCSCGTIIKVESKDLHDKIATIERNIKKFFK
ncbi:MAG: hypothetical protein OEW48_14435 [Phycisphaerae bacterium]|nr:hypothetical protein [Phycisphaerae bacterium]